MTPVHLNAVRCPGIRPDTLGGYLSGLGLLVVASGLRENVRGCWREGGFTLLGRDLRVGNLEEELCRWRPRPYHRWWAPHQKADTKAKSDRNLWAARNTAAQDEVELLDSHIVGAGGNYFSSGGRNYFNPVFGTGGNIGKRDIAKVYDEALRLIADAHGQARRWLRATLFEDSDVSLPELRGAGTWFVSANKLFNSGQQWYREGQISPWSFLLALEGARLLAGGASRRISAARHYAVFPFVSISTAAEASQDAAGGRAEFWAPLWSEPASLSAVRTLIARGQARVGERPASAPFEFALAARSRGVDAGVSQFVRFSLRQTTSRQTYEALPQEEIATSENHAVAALAALRDWVVRLPRDGPNDKRFFGIRGRVERALIRLAAEPDEPERWQELLLLLATAQTQIDRNKDLRKSCIPVPLLDSLLFHRAWPSPAPELWIARSVASVLRGVAPEGWLKRPGIIQTNIFGVREEITGQGRPWLRFPETRPNRAVWDDAAPPLACMVAVLERRLTDTDAGAASPLHSKCDCPVQFVHDFMEGALDDAEIGRWIPPLSLLDWSRTQAVSGWGGQNNVSPGGSSRMHDFFRPLFHPESAGKPVPVAALRQLLKLICQGWSAEAFAFARAKYLAIRGATVRTPSDVRFDGERLAAALLIPVAAGAAERRFNPWRIPQKNQ